MSFYTVMHTLLKNSTKLGLFPSLTLSSCPTFFLKHWRIQPRSLTAPSIQHVLCLLKRWLHIKALLNTGLCCFIMLCHHSLVVAGFPTGRPVAGEGGQVQSRASWAEGDTCGGWLCWGSRFPGCSEQLDVEGCVSSRGVV